MTGSLRVAWLVLAGVLLGALPASGQLKFAGFSTDMSGAISTGYDADFGNQTSSDHNWVVGGSGGISGSYYSPRFLSFSGTFFLNQSRANSDFQSISNASGINASATIFGGSPFPGQVSYSKTYNNEGNYAVPGLANYVTHGDSDAFAVNWSERLEGVPSLVASFQMGSSKYSVYGSNDQGTNTFHTLNLHSSYRLAGFGMGGYVTKGDSNALIPEVVSGAANTETQSGDDALGFNVSHRLPWQGSFGASINRSSYNTSYLGSNTSSTVDMFNSTASMHPTNKVSISASADYSDNLSGQLEQAILAAGGVTTGTNSNESSNSVDLLASVGYLVKDNLDTSAYAERRNQSYLGEEYSDQSFGATVTYGHKLRDGNINASLNMSDNTSNTSGGNVLGITSTANYNGEFKGWGVNGSFGYSQNVQTLLVTEMNSSFNYSGSLRRHWGKLSTSVGAGAGRTGLTQVAGTTSSTQSYNAALGYGTALTANGSYSRSSGLALATGAGLVTVTPGTPVLPSTLTSLYGGNGYSFGLSSSPIRGLTMSSSYGKSSSNTLSNSVSSTNETDEFNSFLQYQQRKIVFTSGYSRLGQGFSSSGTAPEVVSSFYMGVSRWFNLF